LKNKKKGGKEKGNGSNTNFGNNNCLLCEAYKVGLDFVSPPEQQS